MQITVTVGDNAGNSLTQRVISIQHICRYKTPANTLIGDADLEVFPLTEESSIPGAIVTDGYPSICWQLYHHYNRQYQYYTRSAVIFTYTAADDGAGNAGNSITRTVTVGQPNIILALPH